MKITVGPKLFIEGASPLEIAELKELCTFKNPAWFAWKKQVENYPARKYSLPEPEEYIFTFSQKDNTLTVPRYLLETLEKNRKIEIVDLTVAPKLSESITKNFTYRTGQEPAVEDLFTAGHGILCAPCGSGKTTMALGLLYKLKLNTIILVHTDLLLKQTIQEIKTKLGYDAGIIGGGKWKIKPITVATVQTLARRDLSEINKYFGLLIGDEIQYFAATTFVAVIQQFYCKHKYGFSATPSRADGLDGITNQTIGPVIHRIANTVPQDAGSTIKPTYEFIDTPFQPKKVWGAWELPQHINALCRDKIRNEFVVKTIKSKLNGYTLVLTDRVEHAEWLTKELKALSPVLYHGQLAPKEKDAVKAKWATKVKLTIATVDSLGVGTDIPYWEEVWLVTPTSNFNRLTQIAGRVSRFCTGKTHAKIWDFRDPNDLILVQKANKRKKTYEQL